MIYEGCEPLSEKDKFRYAFNGRRISSSKGKEGEHLALKEEKKKLKMYGAKISPFKRLLGIPQHDEVAKSAMLIAIKHDNRPLVEYLTSVFIHLDEDIQRAALFSWDVEDEDTDVLINAVVDSLKQIHKRMTYIEFQSYMTNLVLASPDPHFSNGCRFLKKLFHHELLTDTTISELVRCPLVSHKDTAADIIYIISHRLGGNTTIFDEGFRAKVYNYFAESEGLKEKINGLDAHRMMRVPLSLFTPDGLDWFLQYNKDINIMSILPELEREDTKKHGLDLLNKGM